MAIREIGSGSGYKLLADLFVLLFHKTTRNYNFISSIRGLWIPKMRRYLVEIYISSFENMGEDLVLKNEHVRSFISI